ncbi:hypothetical protein KAFR_0I00770 [Kazachstania africana CBS 2517]|uniref:GDT1 family protein n=1 Tax=Kazachstania africana (strain ATCC 22294 / BCRC 22015 / CBS 2517 / CECT 1963 / NBRC 1671 / NRRL Y-8276) TaxID=1071382 RepID=H2AZQ8_KAZAF|nr:hypothetical protein KAFR_0I00770 [Kazachstania africana CBS 2517]CCF59858.1 hypothetical protein KAFR_0I00770 [Kazachstania africana CBS 2517]
MAVSDRTLYLLLAIIPLISAASVDITNQAAGSDELPKSGFSSFIMAISMIGISEIGDKTFLIAALMAMRHPRWVVFSSAASSLIVMTVLSGVVGHTFVSFIPQRYTSFAAGILFLLFGYKLTMEGLEMSKDAGVEEEMAEVEEEIAIKDMNKGMNDIEAGGAVSDKMAKNQSVVNMTLQKINNLASLVFSPVWIQIFAMVFLGEFGDRSQISIIAMASDNNYWYTIFGGVVGHAICTAFAVIGGRFIATKISMRTVTLGGAFFFFIFALVYIWDAFQ